MRATLLITFLTLAGCGADGLPTAPAPTTTPATTTPATATGPSVVVSGEARVGVSTRF